MSRSVPGSRVVGLCLVAVLAGCGSPSRSGAPEPHRADAPPNRAAVGAAQWDSFVASFLEQSFAAQPAFAVQQGLHKYDGQLPDWSPEGLATEIARLEKALADAKAFEPAGLDAARQFEREYMLARIDGDLFWLAERKEPLASPLYYSGSLDPDVYVTREYAPLAERLKAITRLASNIPAATDQIRANLRTPMPRTYAEVGEMIYGGFAEFFAKDVPRTFASVDDPALQAEFAAANAKAIASLKDLAKYFKAQKATATDDYAIGAERFADMLRRTEGVTTSIDELRRIGEADLQRNLDALAAACAEIAPRKPVARCVEMVQADKPEGGAVAVASSQLASLKEFIVDKDIVTIPGPEQALVKEAPPYNRWNGAYISIPGPFEDNLPSIYYIAPPDPSWSKAEQKAYIPDRSDLLFISVHEVWPGHFLNFLHSNRTRSKFGQTFVGYAFAEGWAHYTEELMWISGLGDGDPRAHVGQLRNALLRNVRFLSAIGLHTGGMTVKQSEKMFRDKAYQDPASARQQAARGTFDPAYINYTMGKLMIMKLRDDWAASRGGQKAWKQFHDQFLGFGGPPIPLVRRAMLAGSDAAVDDLF